jgi:hypothetical protein
MKIDRDIVGVVADPVAGEVNVVVPGLRFALTISETSDLALGLQRSLEQLCDAPQPDSGTPDGTNTLSRPTGGIPDGQPSSVGPDDADVRSAWVVAPESEAAQKRTRALIHANIKNKGLSLREEHRA